MNSRNALLIILTTFFSLSNAGNQPKIITIGIIEPIKHQAMDEIVAGFSSVTDKYNQEQNGNKIVIRVENAQADMNLEHAIIQKMKLAKYDVIAPIGVDATYMTLSQIKNTPVVSIASDLNDKQRNKLKPCNVAVVHDEISNTKLIDFANIAYPKVSKILLIYSNSNKVFPQVANFEQVAHAKGISVNKKMVTSLPELNNTLRQSVKDNQMIFILKDHLIVSAIADIAQVAARQKIPLVTSDEGSVINGGGVALGVPEREIGKQSANLALQIIGGKMACSLPIDDMTNLYVFINKQSLVKSGQNPQQIIEAANKSHYVVKIVG